MVFSKKCRTDNYFIPRESAEETLLKKYAGNKIVEAYIKDEKYEMELYSKYKLYYGYVFYIGKKYSAWVSLLTENRPGVRRNQNPV